MAPLCEDDAVDYLDSDATSWNSEMVDAYFDSARKLDRSATRGNRQLKDVALNDVFTTERVYVDEKQTLWQNDAVTAAEQEQNE